MKTQRFLACLAFSIALPSMAATATGPKPTMVFTQMPGGYQVAQPVGPNLSSTPRPVTSTGSFTARAPIGGKHFTASSGSGPMRQFDQAGIFDIKPSPSSNNTASIKSVSKIPTKALLKAIGKSLPILGTAIAIQELGNELANTANAAKDPSDIDNYSYTPENGVHALKSALAWSHQRDPSLSFSSPDAACNSQWQMQSGKSGAYSNGVTWGAGNNMGAECEFLEPATVNTPATVIGVGSVYSRAGPISIKPFSFDNFDSLPDSALPPDSLIEPAANLIPQIDIQVPDQVPDLSVDAQPPPDIVTVTKPNGNTVTTTTISSVTINNNDVRITTNTTVVTRTPLGVEVPTDPLDLPTNVPPATPPSDPFNMPCGISGSPPCGVKVDESGTPPPPSSPLSQAEDNLDAEKQKVVTAIEENKSLEIGDWTWSFQLPTGCTPITLDMIVPVVLDVCRFQSIIHDLMAMVWAGVGVFGLFSIFRMAVH